MCLAIPGKIISVDKSDSPMMRTGRVSFGGIIKEVNLSYTPEANLNDYVIVHVGFALKKLDESEANKVFDYLKEMEDIDELKEGEQ